MLLTFYWYHSPRFRYASAFVVSSTLWNSFNWANAMDFNRLPFGTKNLCKIFCQFDRMQAIQVKIAQRFKNFRQYVWNDDEKHPSNDDAWVSRPPQNIIINYGWIMSTHKMRVQKLTNSSYSHFDIAIKRSQCAAWHKCQFLPRHNEQTVCLADGVKN